MRNFLWIAVLLFACNSQESGNNTSAVKDNGTADENKASAGSSGACGKLIFFQPGAEIETKTFDASGEEVSIQHTKILEVKNEEGMTVAYVEAKDMQVGGKTIDVKYDYKCDGRNIYFDIASMFRTEAKERDASFTASTIEYPIDVKAGETLPDATGTMTTEKNGKKMEMKYHYKQRKVGEKEDVTTTAGTWSCYPVSNVIEVEMDMPGMDEKAKKIMESMRGQMKMTSTTWFAPDFGIVKMEMYQNGKMMSRNEITGVKR